MRIVDFELYDLNTLHKCCVVLPAMDGTHFDSSMARNYSYMKEVLLNIPQCLNVHKKAAHSQCSF